MMRRTLLHRWVLAFVPGLALAQGPTTSRQFGCEPNCFNPDGRGGSSPNNMYLQAGAQFGYKLGGYGDIDAISDFFVARAELHKVFSARPLWGGALSMPLIGNFGKVKLDDVQDAAKNLQELVSGANGIQAMVSPYITWGRETHQSWALDLYANIGTKINTFKLKSDSTRTATATQWRLSAGLDLSVFIKKDSANSWYNKPVSIIVEPVFANVDSVKMKQLLGTARTSLKSVEATVMMPLPAPNTSLILQIVGLESSRPFWRVGLLTFKEK